MRKKSAGFTVLEVILAITVLTIAVSGSFILISQTIGSVSQIQSRLIASYLVQEGLETIRNIRDSNWLKSQAWDQGLEGGDCLEGDYQTGAPPDYPLLTSCYLPYPCDLPCQYEHLLALGIDGNGFYSYNYTPENKTIFKRKITISDRVDLDDPLDEEFDKFKVSVEVFWREKGQIRSLPAQEYLYNWNK